LKRLLTKKFAIIFSIVIVLCAITATTCFALMPKANLKPSDYDQGLTYEQAAKEGKPILALFYVDWCAYCKRFVPKYDKVRTLNKFNFNFVMINVEDPENQLMVLHEIINKDLSVRQTETLVKALSTPKKTVLKQSNGDLPEMHSNAKHQLHEYIQSEVSIKRSRKGKGTITIVFNNDTDFQRIIDLIKKDN
jgi:thiol-disulfide isomerase/thioredoxin